MGGCISRNIFTLRFSSSYMLAGTVLMLDAVLDVALDAALITVLVLDAVLSSDSDTLNTFNEAFFNDTFRHRC